MHMYIIYSVLQKLRNSQFHIYFRYIPDTRIEDTYSGEGGHDRISSTHNIYKDTAKTRL